MSRPMTVAVLGAGLIGLDLAQKAARSQRLDLRAVITRGDEGVGVRRARRLQLPVAIDGLTGFLARDSCDLMFDATNALSHADHRHVLRGAGVKVVDLTPSAHGHLVVPGINGAEAVGHDDVNLVSCGGQAALPLVHAISQLGSLDYVEVVSTAASRSVGRSTRLNLDEYIETTQRALTEFTGVHHVKVMINISPATPPAMFRTAITMTGASLNDLPVEQVVDEAAERVRTFAPGYDIRSVVRWDSRVLVTLEVLAGGNGVPTYAGNLDIINAVAVDVAERCAIEQQLVTQAGRA